MNFFVELIIFPNPLKHFVRFLLGLKSTSLLKLSKQFLGMQCRRANPDTSLILAYLFNQH